MRLLVLYGSQTGTAQDLAEQIWRESKRYGLTGPVLAFDDYPIEKLVTEQLVVFVVSTTDDGVEPDNMRQAWRFLLKRSLPATSLQSLSFTCLGLGDSSYQKFNFAAKKLSKRLLNLGAKVLCPVAYCDDQHDNGIFEVSMRWTEILFSTLSNAFGLKRLGPAVRKWQMEILPGHKLPQETHEQLLWSKQQPPHTLQLIENKRTTAPDHYQDVRLLRFSGVSEAPLSWQPGDTLDVLPQNSKKQVQEFFDIIREHRLDFDRETVVRLSNVDKDMPLPIAYTAPLSVFQAAKYVWDLSAKPMPGFLTLLAQNCEDEMEQEKLLEFCNTEGINDMLAYIYRPRRTLLEVLSDFRHATSKLTLETIFDMMPLLQPRSFSIASDASTGSLDLLVAVVNYNTIMQTPRLGVCSNWLKSLVPGNRIRAVFRPGTFSLPKDLTTPLIMIGPGTGIAPFRSFIQSRQRAREDGAEVGQLIVFFGCRSKTKDFHFQADFDAWAEPPMRVESYFAFSRDQDQKVYVQHKIQNNAKYLARLISEENAYVYVAGSSNSMPKAVREAFIEVLDAAYLENMIKQRRYQEETWT